MARKSARPSGAKAVQCDQCKTEAHGIAGKTHRWCRGSKAERKTGKQRGTWQ